jgi:hypothetical protein
MPVSEPPDLTTPFRRWIRSCQNFAGFSFHSFTAASPLIPSCLA